MVTEFDVEEFVGLFEGEVERVVEQEGKKWEIEKVRRAVERRKEGGHYQGAPWKGTEFDSAGEYLVALGDDEWRWSPVVERRPQRRQRQTI